ncbi:MAG: hypothetical protein ACJATT_004258 [Myxococcota bacterium]|jgi:hypothetical protein
MDWRLDSLIRGRSAKRIAFDAAVVLVSCGRTRVGVLMLRMLCCLWVPSVAMAVPLTFTHQARVTDSSGTPINGAHDITIALYDGASASTPVWDETQSTTLSDGYVSMQLGTDPADPLNTGTIVDGGSLWLGITVGTGPEMSVRTEVGSALYAMRAGAADTALIAGSATTAATATSATTATNLDGGTVDATSVDVSGLVTANALVLGDPGSACSLPQTGMMRYAGGEFQGCDGAVWKTLSVDDDTLPTAGQDIAVTGSEVSVSGYAMHVRQRMARYHAICLARIIQSGVTYNTIAAVTPGDSTVQLTGTQVCQTYVGNNARSNFDCLTVPYVYSNIGGGTGSAGYVGTDVRPQWRGCGTVSGPGAATGNYPWLNPNAGTGVMMACCYQAG